jgi:predicted nuclease of predicted toxin-antitoxin system
VAASSNAVGAAAVRGIGLRDTTDDDIFRHAKVSNVVVMTKDRDFVDLVERHGPPRQIIWVTCGNASNRRLRELLAATLEQAIALLQGGEPLVELREP